MRWLSCVVLHGISWPSLVHKRGFARAIRPAPYYCTIVPFFTGMPREIHSDNQSIISPEFFDAPCSLAGITQAKSIVHRPQSNGRAERASLSSMLCGYT